MRRDGWRRLLSLAAVLGLLWTALVAAGGDVGSNPPAAEEEQQVAEVPPAGQPAATDEAATDEAEPDEPLPEPASPPPEEQPPPEEELPPPVDEPAAPTDQVAPPGEQAEAAPSETTLAAAEEASPGDQAEGPATQAGEDAPGGEQVAEEAAPAVAPAGDDQGLPAEEPAAHAAEEAPPATVPPDDAEPPPVEPPAAAEQEPPPVADRAVALITSITTRKFTDPPRSNQSFPFTLSGPSFGDSFSIAHGQSHTSTLPGAGSYTLTETVPAGWQIVDIECTDGAVKQTSGGQASITLTVAAGDAWSCTVNDRQQATIVIEKVVDFDDDAGFDFTGDLGAFTIDPDGLSGSQTFANLDPDVEYTVTETVPSGWDFAGVLCSDKTSGAFFSVTIDPGPGSTTTCTFTNEAQQGTVTVVKVADPVDGTEFSFFGDLGAFTLVAESGPPPPDPGPPEGSALGRSQHEETFTVDPGSYDIAEDVPAGWLLRSVECTVDGGGDPGTGRSSHDGVTATVGPGEDVTCTFANVRLATLTLVKDADPSDGTRFPIIVDEERPGRPGTGQVASFELADGEEEQLTGLAPGRYVVAEDPPAGWGLASVDCGGAAVGPGTAPDSVIVTVGGGEDVRCTLENRKSARITIAKEADVDDGTQFPFSGDLGDFFLTSSAGGGDEGGQARQEEPPEQPPTGEQQLTFTVDPGTYVVTEGQLPGWDLAGIACQGGKTRTSGGAPGPRSVPPNSVEITAAAGDVVECTFQNEARPGSLTIRKEADPADGTAFDFTFSPGEGEQAFSLRDGEEETFADLTPASYRVVEAPPPGWGVSGIDCGPAEAAIDEPAGTVDVTVGPGEDVTCVFTNTDVATITIVKDAVPADGTDFGFDGDLGRFELDVDPPAPPPPGDGEEDGGEPPPQPRQGDDELPDRRVFEVAPGTYTVAEDASEAWELVAIACGGEPPPPPGPPPPDPRAATKTDLGSRSVTIEIAAGESVECTFRNRPRPVPLTIVKEADPSDGTSFSVVLKPAAGAATTLELSDGDQETLDVAAGEVVITEQLPPGWGLREVRCDSPVSLDRSLATARVTIRPGTPQTCTLVNTRRANITIVKQAVPQIETTFGFGGDLGLFTLTVPPPPPGQPPGDGGGEEVAGQGLAPAARQTGEEGKPGPERTSFEVDPGTYDVAEQPAPGWELVAIRCAGVPTDPRPPGSPQPRNSGATAAVVDLASATASLTVQPGDVVECTFENRQVERGLTIVKEAEPADGTDFGFTVDAGPRAPASFTLDDDTDPTRPDRVSFEVAGRAVVEEAAVDGWDLASIVCNVPGAEIDLAARRLVVELAAGAAATCTFTNRKRVSITVIKSTTPAGGEGFPFELKGEQAAETFTLDDRGRVTLTDLPAGSYSLTELVPAGWALQEVSCAQGVGFARRGATVQIETAPGAGAVCTFGNVRLGSLRGEIFLDLDGDGTRDEGEPDLADVVVLALWAGFDGEFGTGDDEEFSTTSTAGNSYTFDELPPGSYRVTAVEPDRLEATAAQSFTTELAPGGTAEGAAFAFAGADLELTIAASTEAPRATVPFQVTVTITNRGPQTPGGVEAGVVLSPGLRFDRATGAGTYDPAAGRWVVGDVPAGETRTLVLTVTPERAGDVVRAEAEITASGLLDPDSTPGNAVPGEDDQDATRAFTVGVAPVTLLPATGSEAASLVPPALVFLLGGLVLVVAGRVGRQHVAAGRAGRRRRL